MEDKDLIPEDWNAAEEAIATNGKETANRDERLRFYAVEHARLGDRTFRRLHGLRPPRNRREMWRLQFERGEITEQEFDQLRQEDDHQPLDLEIVDSYYEELHERLEWLIKFWQAIMVRSDALEKDRQASISGAQRDRYFKEVGGPGSLSQVQIDALVTLIEQVRVERNLGLAAWGNYSGACAQLLLTTVRDITKNRWKTCINEVAERLLADPENLPSPPEVLMKAAWDSPPFLILSGILRQEAAAVRLALVRNPPLGEIRFSDWNLVPAGQKRTIHARMSSKTAVKEHRIKDSINFKNWALGLADGKHWYLFHRTQNRWDQRAKVKFAEGHQIRLLTAFVEGGGSLFVKRGIDLQRPHYPGTRDGKILTLIKHTISDLRQCIRGIIAEALQSEIESSMNPIRLNSDRWTAEIEIGVAAWDDGKLCFEVVKRGG